MVQIVNKMNDPYVVSNLQSILELDLNSDSVIYNDTSQYQFTLERKYINLNISDKTGSRL